MNERDFEALVRAGLLAPSADNAHTLRFEHDDSAINLWDDGGHAAAPYHRQVLRLMAAGAVAENLLLRGLALGWAGKLTVAPDLSEPLLIARIEFSPCRPAGSALDHAIDTRHTNRTLRFHGPPLDVTERASISADLLDQTGTKAAWLDDPGVRRRVAGLAWLAEAERIRQPELHRELFSSIRFDQGWRQSVSVGLPLGALGVEWLQRPAFLAMRHPRVARLGARSGLHRVYGFRAGYLPCRLTPHLVVLESPAPDALEGAWFVGRALQRLWLLATQRGLAVQPMAAPAIFALHESDAVPNRIKDRLTAGWSRLHPGAMPMMLVRLGHARPPTIRAMRPSAHEHVRTIEGQSRQRDP